MLLLSKKRALVLLLLLLDLLIRGGSGLPLGGPDVPWLHFLGILVVGPVRVHLIQVLLESFLPLEASDVASGELVLDNAILRDGLRKLASSFLPLVSLLKKLSVRS